MSTRFDSENAASRARLRRLAEQVSDVDLSQMLSAGWTVAGIFAHLAFWDQRALTLLLRWKHDGVAPSPVDADAINDAAKSLCLAMAPRKAVEICLKAAEAVDVELASITPQMASEIAAKVSNFRLSRAVHRNEHLEEIDAVLAQNH